jgi:uncharacterized protein YceK
VRVYAQTSLQGCPSVRTRLQRQQRPGHRLAQASRLQFLGEVREQWDAMLDMPGVPAVAGRATRAWVVMRRWVRASTDKQGVDEAAALVFGVASLEAVAGVPAARGVAVAGVGVAAALHTLSCAERTNGHTVWMLQGWLP